MFDVFHGMKSLAVLVGLAAALIAGCAGDASESSIAEHSLRRVYVTDAGMHGLWSPEAYRDVGEHNWQAHFTENSSIEAHIARGEFVPIYVHSDGAPVIEVRVDSDAVPARLTEQERSWVKVASDPYLFVSNCRANVSGIEYIGGQPTVEVSSIAVPPGRWRAVVHLLSWPENSYDEKTRYPPDFIVTLTPETGATVYRQVTETFPEGDW